MPQEFDRWIDRFAARVRLGEFLRRGAEWGAAYLFVFGAAVLVVKLLAPQGWPHVLWLAAGGLPLAGMVWWVTRSACENRWQSIARLDAALETGGLLMTLSERPDGNWTSRLPQVEKLWRDAIPRVRPRRFATYLALPCLFAVGACLVPLRDTATATPLFNTVGQQATRELEQLLEEIDKDQVLEEEEEEQLKEEVARLTEETRDTPLTHEKWETVDALRERMRVRLESASVTLATARDAAAMLADALRPDAPELTVERAEQLEKNLTESLQKLLQKKGGPGAAPQELQDQLQRLMKNGKLQIPEDAGEREELLDELREYLEQENKKLSDLRKKCSTCKSGQGDEETECEGGQCPGGGREGGNRPGRGGVSRGRGDAELTWGDEADQQGVKFKETVLPKGFLDQPKDDVVGIEKTAPTEEPAVAAPRAAARAVDPAAGETTWNRKLNPRHRNTVRKYFDGGSEKKQAR